MKKQDEKVQKVAEVAGSITLGDKIWVGQNATSTSNGSYVGNIGTGGGDFIGRDKLDGLGLEAEILANTFRDIAAHVETMESLPEPTRKDLQADLREVLNVALLGDRADSAALERWLRSIERISPDVLTQVTTALTDPMLALSPAVTGPARAMRPAPQAPTPAA